MHTMPAEFCLARIYGHTWPQGRLGKVLFTEGGHAHCLVQDLRVKEEGENGCWGTRSCLAQILNTYVLFEY